MWRKISELKIIISGLIFWFLCVGSYTTFDIIFGCLSVISSYFIKQKVFQQNTLDFKSTNFSIIKIIKYILYMIVEMWKASYQVLKVILFDKNFTQENYQILTIKNNDYCDNVFLAHSITFTPGTITCEMKDNMLFVHCINNRFAQDLQNSQQDMLQQINHLQIQQ